MFYTTRHITRFRYSNPISQNVMEVRMQPRSEGHQRCLNFNLVLAPRTRVNSYLDHLGNTVHHFDIPGRHRHLTITTEALVELRELPPLPAALEPDAWQALDEMVEAGDYWEMLMPSLLAQPTDLLQDLARELGVERRADPLTVLHEVNTAIYNTLEYVKHSTKVDSPIDDALQARRGVCQDFAHVMVALVRELRIPCRYVSGYLYQDMAGQHDRDIAGATHAWVEALLPGLGWVGFDPTANQLADTDHIRVAAGRDYADVPPTKGVFKGQAEGELSVSVQVRLSEDAPLPETPVIIPVEPWTPLEDDTQQQQQ